MKPRSLFFAALTLALLLPTTSVVAEETNHWSFDVVPYLWVAGVDVQTSLQNPSSLPPSTSPDVARFDTRISAGALLAAQARYRSVGVFVDFAWLRLDSDALHPGPAFSDVNLKSDFIHTTAALTYRLPLQGPIPRGGAGGRAPLDDQRGDQRHERRVAGLCVQRHPHLGGPCCRREPE